MKHSWTWSWLLVPVVVTALLSGLAAQPRWSTPPELVFRPPALNCQPADQVSPGYTIDTTAIQPRPSGTLLSGESFLQVDVCRPGTLVVSGVGELAGQELPRLWIMQNADLLTTVDFAAAARTVEVPIRRPGRVILAYLNDFHADEARTLTLKDFGLQGCPAVEPQVPPATGGQWYPAERIATLQSGVAMTVTACQAGSLSFMLRGQPAGGRYPTLDVRQAGQLRTVQLSGPRYTRVAVRVQAGPVELQLRDPYRVVTGDRNILLTGVRIRH